MKDLAVTVNSNGGTIVFPNIRPLKQAEKKLARLQKTTLEKEKG